MSRPIAIDLFGGFGGVAIGMLRSGFRVVSIDAEPLCKRIKDLNLPSAVVSITADLMKAEPLELLERAGVCPKDVAWLHGSPECRDHSIARGARPTTGKGHNALLVMPKWAKLFPNAHITVENVAGMRDSHRYPKMIAALSQNRDVREYLVNALWYGVPQHRRRLFVCAGPVGGACIPVPPPTCDILQPKTWTWAMTNPRPIEDIDDDWCDKPTPWQVEGMPYVGEGQTSADITDPEMREWIEQMFPGMENCLIRRLHRHRPVSTVLTGVNIKRLLRHVHPWLDRPSTVRECARFQGFPDEFRFPVSMLKLADAYRGIGNAVPPPVAAAFGRLVRKAA